jgi:hypothetical protein
MTASIVEIRQSIQRMVCTGCGAEANASCNCGVVYQPKSVRAAEAVTANPEKSDRAIAKEIGVHHSTVNEARKQLSDNPTVERTGLDGKKRKMPEKQVADGAEGVPQAQADPVSMSDAYAEARKAVYAAEAPETKEDDSPMADGEEMSRDEAIEEWVAARRRERKLEKRKKELSAAFKVMEAAFNAVEAREGRNWPADMKPEQLKKRDRILRDIACLQRSLEQLYGEVTGQASWRVEVTTKDGKRLGTGALSGTRGEAEYYNTLVAPNQLEGDYAAGEVIPCKEKANVEIEGDSIFFSHGDCVLLNWGPVAVDNEVDPATSAEEMKAKFANDLTIPNSLKQR